VSGGSNHLYGYRYVPGREDGQGIRVENPEQAQVVRDIFRWLLEDGLTIQPIVRRLYALGIPSPEGNKTWSRGTVYFMLTNSAYTGQQFLFRKTHEADGRVVARPQAEWIQVPNPPIIDEATFSKAKEHLWRNKQMARRNTKRDYLLSSYLFCGQCGRRYAGTARVRRGKTYRYYGCPARHEFLGGDGCSNRRWNAQALEESVWQEIEAALTDPHVVMAALEGVSKVDDADSHLAELDTIEGKLKQMDREKERVWTGLRLSGDEEQFASEIIDIKARIEGLRRRKVEIQERMEAATQAKADIVSVERACGIIRGNLTKPSFERKRQVLEALNVRIRLNGDRVSLEGTLPRLTQEAPLSVVSNTSQPVAARPESVQFGAIIKSAGYRLEGLVQGKRGVE